MAALRRNLGAKTSVICATNLEEKIACVQHHDGNIILIGNPGTNDIQNFFKNHGYISFRILTFLKINKKNMDDLKNAAIMNNRTRRTSFLACWSSWSSKI